MKKSLLILAALLLCVLLTCCAIRRERDEITGESDSSRGITDPLASSIAIAQPVDFGSMKVTEPATGEIKPLSELLGTVEPARSITEYTILDLNGDGEEELIFRLAVGANEDYGFMILHKEGEALFANELSYRSFYELKADGSFDFSSGVANNGIGRMHFASGTYTVERLARCESEDNQQVDYFIGDAAVTKEEFEAYRTAQTEKESPTWRSCPAENQ